MRAAVYDRYGGPIVLREVPQPVPGDTGVLVRVHAASVNSWDWDQFAGTFQGRLGNPWRPYNPILGADVAGVVEAVGSSVTRFKPGDAVFGDLCEGGWGGFAECVAADEKWLARKPEGMGFVEAAAIPQAGMLALQAVRKHPLGPGTAVLINGGGGGVGSFAIQMAKRLGAEVTAVDRAEKLTFMTGLGADHTIAFDREDFAGRGERYDLVVDVQARRPTGAHLRVLKPGGHYVIIGGASPRIIGAALAGLLGRPIGLLLYEPSVGDLEEMARLCSAGVTPAIDAVYPLQLVEEALRHVGEGRAKGKVVVQVRTGIAGQATAA